jgi:Mg-chelatase subunit ChlD
VVAMVRDALQEEDRVAIVTFSDKAKVCLPLSNPKDESISGIINSLKTVCLALFLFLLKNPFSDQNSCM